MPDEVGYYLSKGFDCKKAEYYASGRRKIVSVAPDDDFTLVPTFDKGGRDGDAKPFIEDGTVFKPLMGESVFQRVYLDEYGAVSWDIDPSVDSRKVWNNKIDLCPDSSYIDSVPL